MLPGGRLIGGGKQGRYYVLDPATMLLTQDHGSPDFKRIGQGFQAFVNTYHPEYSEADYAASQGFGPNIHGGPVYWRGPSYVYQMPEKDFLKAYYYDPSTGRVHHEAGPAAAAKVRPANGMPGGHSSLSANGDRDGIVWTIRPLQDATMDPRATGQLHAFDALTLDEIIWADPKHPDPPELFAKFNPPTIADGKVFRPAFAQYIFHDQPSPPEPQPHVWNAAPELGHTPGKVIVYGLLPDSRPPRPARRGATITDLLKRAGGSGLLAVPVGEEVELGDDRGGRRRDFTGTLSSRLQRVSSRAVADLGTPTFHYPSRTRVEVRASVFWSEETGAHVVAGEIREEYLRQGGPTGALGYPTESETDTDDDHGRISRFERGEIVWDAETGAATRRRDSSPGSP